MKQSTCFFLLLALVAILSVITAQLLGVDLSAENIKIAAVRAGNPFHIVVDEQAKRKIPLAIAFDDGSRQFGNNAIGFALRKPLDTYLYAQRLLGQTMDAGRLKDLQNSFGYTYTSLDKYDRGVTVGIEARDGTIFTPEELVAMSLQHVIKLAHDDGNVNVRDLVITVPHWFTAMEKTALLNAAELAGLNVVSLVTDTAASAVQYGLDRTWDNASLNTTQNIVIIDVGASGTEFSFVQYTGVPRRSGQHRVAGQAQVVASVSDEHIGGHYIDRTIRDFFLQTLDERLTAKPRKDKTTVADIKAQPRSMAKLLKAAQGAKNILSANNEAKVHIESIYKDIDLSLVFPRAKLQELIEQTQLKPLEAAVQTFLKECQEQIVAQKIQNVTLNADKMIQFDDVIVVGGSSRVPSVQAALKQAFGVEKIAQTLNSDEAMVMGAVYIAANQSISFQVKPFLLSDINNGDVHVHIASTDDILQQQDDNTTAESGVLTIDTTYPQDAAEDTTQSSNNKHVVLFPKHSPTNKRKTLTLTRNSDVVVALNYHQNDVCENCHAAIGGYLVNNITTVYNDYLKSEEKKHQVEQEKGLRRVAINETLSTEENEELYKKTLEAPKGVRVSLTFTTADTGIPRLLQAEALLDDWTIVDESIEANKKAKKLWRAQQAKEKAEKAKKAAAAAEKAANATTTTGEETLNTTDVTNATTTNTTAEFVPLPPSFALKKLIKRVPLQITGLDFQFSAQQPSTQVKLSLREQKVLVNGFIPMKAVDFEQSKIKLNGYSERDNARRFLSDFRNSLETLLYTIRSELDVDNDDDQSPIAIVTTAAQREELLEKVTETATWLEDVGDDYSDNDESVEWYYAKGKTIQEQISLLNVKYDPIVMRKKEYIDRESTHQGLMASFEKLTELSAGLRVNKTWIVEQLNEFDIKLSAEKQALEALYKEQSEMDQTIDPVWTNGAVAVRMAELVENIKTISRTPKPKPVKVDVKTNSTKGSEEEKTTAEDTKGDDASNNNNNNDENNSNNKEEEKTETENKENSENVEKQQEEKKTEEQEEQKPRHDEL